MSVTGLDHLYVETHEWDLSVAFWSGLGFSFVSQWGSEGHRAGKLELSSAAVVLAEVPADRPATSNASFGLDDADNFSVGDGVEVITPLEDTHWGTRWIRVRDPDGRIYSLETEQSSS